MADVVAPPGASVQPQRSVGWLGSLVAWIRGIPAGYRAIVVEMRKVTWPEVVDVRRATVAIIVFVLLLGLFIYLLDIALNGILVKLIPSLFMGR